MRPTVLQRATRPLALACAGLLIAPWAMAESNDEAPVETRFERSVSADTYLAASVSGIEQLGRHFDGLALHSIWKEDEVSSFFAGSVEMLTEHLEEIKSQAGDSPVSLATLRALLGGRIDLAIGGLTTVQFTPTPSVLLTIEVPSDQHGNFQGLLQQLVDQIPGSQELVRGEFTHHDVTLATLGHEEVQGELCYGFDGELFVAGVGRTYLSDFLDARHGRSEGDRLADLPAFQKAQAKAFGDGSLTWLFLNVDSFRARLGGLVPDTYQSALSDLGVDHVRGLALAVNRQGTGSRTAVYLDAPGEKRGLLKALAPGRIDSDRLGHVPANTVLYATAHYDMASIYDELMGLAERASQEYMPRRYAEQFRRELQAALRMLPVDPQEDVLRPLGAMAELYVALPRQGGLIPDVVLSLDVRDSERLKKTIEQGLSMIDGVEIKQTTYQERTIHYATIRQPDFTLQPAFALTGDRLMIASQVLVLKRAIQWQNSEAETLAQSEDFQRTLAQLHGQPGELLYVNLKDVFSFAYNAAAPALSAVIDPERTPFDAALLPSTESVSEHLSGWAMSYTVDQDGLLFESCGPFGLAAVIEAAMAGVHWAIDQGYGDALLAQAMGGQQHSAAMDRPRSTDSFAQGQALQDAGQYAPAVTAFSKALEADPSNGSIYFQRGYCRHALGEYTAARGDFVRATELGFAPEAATYNVACGYALSGEKEVALEWLARAIEVGFDREDLLRGDSDLDSIRGEARFKELVKRYGID